jgi:ferrochelatase
MNLGSPDSPSVPDVRRYLGEFLMDGRVIDAPWPIRFLIVHGFILPFRPKRSAHAYEQIWTRDGSPLVSLGRRLRERLLDQMTCPVELCMRYQNPSATHALGALQRQGVNRVVLLPLFPHYAMSSYESAVEKVRAETGKFPGMTLDVVAPYYRHPAFLEALFETARPVLAGGYDHVLISFHGIPERHLRKSDPTPGHCLSCADCCDQPSPAHARCYRHQCFETARGFARLSGIPDSKWSVSFQSRLGRDPWLKPDTEAELVRLATSGVRRLVILCPAFVADCLETIEEIGIRAREIFLGHGGTEFHLVPCLNDHPAWIRAVRQLAEERIAPPDAATPQPDSYGREGHAKTQRHEGTGREAPEFR